MDKVLLDTDIFSELLKGIDLRVAANAQAYQAELGIYTISVITVMEIVKGFHKLQREDRIQRFMSQLPTLEVIMFETQAADLAGRIYADLERSGQPIGRADPMIAGIALHHNLILVTGNLAHYQRIQALSYPLRLQNRRT